MSTPKSTNTMAAQVDQLGHLRAQIDKLLLEEKTLRDGFIKANKSGGFTVFEGLLFTVKIVSGTRKVLDMKAVRAKLSKQFLTAHTTKSPFIRLLLQAKKSSKG